MLNSPEMQRVAMATVRGHSGQRMIHFNGVRMTIPAYLRLVSHLSRQVAEQTEAEAENSSAPSKPRGVLKYPVQSRSMYFTFFQAALQGLAAKSRLTARQKVDLADRIADAAIKRFQLHGDRISCALKAVSSEDDRTSLSVSLNLSGPWGQFFNGALSATAGADYDPKSPETPVNAAAKIADEAV